MEYTMDAAAEERLQQYINGVGEILGHPKRREAFARYSLGCSATWSARASNRLPP